LSAAASVQASKSTIELNQNVLRLLNTLETQGRLNPDGGASVGRALVQIDDLTNNGTLVGDGAVDRFAGTLGQVLGDLIKPRAGL
jgi:hypothetical protein